MRKAPRALFRVRSELGQNSEGLSSPGLLTRFQDNQVLRATWFLEGVFRDGKRVGDIEDVQSETFR